MPSGQFQDFREGLAVAGEKDSSLALSEQQSVEPQEGLPRSPRRVEVHDRSNGLIAGDAALRQGHRQASLRTVVCGADEPPADRLDHRLAEPPLRLQIDRGRGAVLHLVDLEEVLAPSQLLPSRPEKDHGVSGRGEPLHGMSVHIVEKADHADGGSRVDSPPLRLVVEGNVPRHDGNVPLAAGLGDPPDGLLELPHDLRPFRVAEVQAIGHPDGPGARAGQVPRCFGHGRARSFVWIEPAVAVVAVHRQGERQGRPLDPHHRSVGAWSDGGVAANGLVVL